MGDQLHVHRDETIYASYLGNGAYVEQKHVCLQPGPFMKESEL
jgi:hypothetical protein